MSHAEGTFTTADGLRIHHQSWLPDAAPRAAVMLLHGLGEHSGRYAHVAEALNRAGCAVHTFDLRGHGRSEGKRVFVRSYDEFLDDIAQFRTLVEQRHPGVPLVVLGHSMGGNLAVGHALDRPDGIVGLVLSAPALAVGSDLTPAKLKAIRMIAKVAPGVRPEGIDAEALSRDPAVVAAYRADPLVYTGKISAGLGAALIDAMQRFPARYGELTMPILVLHGTADRLTGVSGSRALEAAVPGSVTAHYYEGLYHEVFNEPEQRQVLADLTAWLDGLLS